MGVEHYPIKPERALLHAGVITGSGSGLLTEKERNSSNIDHESIIVLPILPLAGVAVGADAHSRKGSHVGAEPGSGHDSIVLGKSKIKILINCEAEIIKGI